MNYHGRVEVGFYDSNRAAVFYEGAGERTQLWGPLALFAAFAIRHLVNLGVNDRTAGELAIVLAATTPESLSRTAGRNDDYVQLVDYPGSPGKKRFVAELRVEDSGRPRFKFDAKGFGLFGQGLGFYSPSSVVLLLRYFSERFLLDDEFQAALSDTSHVVATMFQQGDLRPYAQEHVAVIAANSASRGKSRVRSFPVDGEVADAEDRGTPEDLMEAALKIDEWSTEEVAEAVLTMYVARRTLDEAVAARALARDLDAELWLAVLQRFDAAMMLYCMNEFVGNCDAIAQAARALSKELHRSGVPLEDCRRMYHDVHALTRPGAQGPHQNGLAQAIYTVLQRLLHCSQDEIDEVIGPHYAHMFVGRFAIFMGKIAQTMK